MVNKKEIYKKVILSQQLCLYLKGKPATAKTEIIEQIAKECGLQSITLILANKDSSEINGLPFKKQLNINEETVEITDYTPPKWAILANSKPSLVFFDEFANSTLEVRNCVMDLLITKRISGSEGLKLNDNVYFCAAGNLGIEDNTEGDEMTSAQISRFAIFDHDLTVNEWITNYANTNVNKYICSFIENYSEHFYHDENMKNGKPFANPRSWTKLSNIIGKNTTNLDEIIQIVDNIGNAYVAHAAFEFSKYLKFQKSFSVKEIIDNFSKIEQTILTLSRERINELYKDLENINILDLSIEKLTNIINFLKLTENNADERTGFLLSILNKYSDYKKEIKDHKYIEIFKKEFEEDYNLIFSEHIEEINDMEKK